MEPVFDKNAISDTDLKVTVKEFLQTVKTAESKYGPPIIFQDGVKGSYYIKCSLTAKDAAKLCDLEAKLDVVNIESYRANRQLLTGNNTYLKMKSDAIEGREFSDIIVEYNSEYSPQKPLKVWGGQHRIKAISETSEKANHYHGFRIYFRLSKEQRTELALVSNTNISVSNDTFDRMLEETMFGDALRKWCQKVGLLAKDEDFPDVGSHSEKITVKRARTFVVNFYLGQEKGNKTTVTELDLQVYEPYLAITGVTIDPKYAGIMADHDILSDDALNQAGRRFAALHNAQHKAVTNKVTAIKNTKAYRNKAFVESVLCGWSYVAGLLQAHPDRLENHYRIPKVGKVPDPLNAEEMSQFKAEQDPPTYRGLGTRSSLQDRQRIAQLFLAKSLHDNVMLERSFMNKAVSQVIGLKALSKGYS